jgi:hypothetical protein
VSSEKDETAPDAGVGGSDAAGVVPITVVGGAGLCPNPSGSSSVWRAPPTYEGVGVREIVFM